MSVNRAAESLSFPRPARGVYRRNGKKNRPSESRFYFRFGSDTHGAVDENFSPYHWVAATTYTAAEVGAKDGYAEISWDPAARLIWTSSLEQDNTVLWRHTVDA